MASIVNNNAKQQLEIVQQADKANESHLKVVSFNPVLRMSLEKEGLELLAERIEFERMSDNMSKVRAYCAWTDKFREFANRLSPAELTKLGVRA